MPLRRSLKELAGGGCYTHGAPTELAASVGPVRARMDADRNVGAPVALHHKSRPLRGLPFYLRPHARHSHASSAGSRRSSLAPPRLLHSVSALELTDLRARRSGTQRRRTSRPAFGRSGRTTLARIFHTPMETPTPRRVPSRGCLLYTSPSPRDRTRSRMPSSA